MTDFDYEVKQKKSLVPSARRRKGGSKSKKCSLPSDNLTEAQKRKLNGPVYTVKMDRPMTWEELKGLPDTLRRQYLTNLIDTYEASQRMLGDMLGVSQATAGTELRRLGVQSGPAHGRESHGPVAERRKAMWEAFCNGVVGGGNAVNPTENEQIEPKDEQVESAEPGECSEIPTIGETVPEWCSENTPAGKPRLDAAEFVSEIEHPKQEEVQAVPELEQEPDGSEENPVTEESVHKEVLTRLAGEYDGSAEAVYASIGELMALFGGAEVHVKIVVGKSEATE